MMSSKKIQLRGRIDEEVAKEFIQEAKREFRKQGSMLEKILRERYQLSGGGQGVKNADQR